MGRYQVSTCQGQQVEVGGSNWLVALGLGLDALGMVADIDRLACEVLLGGTVIVRDVRAGKRFVVQGIRDDDEPLVEIEGPDEPRSPAAIEDQALLLGEDDFDEDALEDIADISSELIPIGSDDEATLAASRSPVRHHEPAPAVADRSAELVTVPIEALLAPADHAAGLEASIASVAGQIDAAHSSFEAWRLALEGACRLLGAESGAALSVEEDGALRFLFAVGPRAHEVLGRRLPPSCGIAGFCTQRSVGLLITEPRRDPRFFSRMDQTSGYTTTSVLAVPVAAEDGVLGCLELLNAPAGFQQVQLQWLGALAASLATRLIAEPA